MQTENAWENSKGRIGHGHCTCLFGRFHTCKLCDLQLSLWWQTWEPVDFAAWTPLTPFLPLTSLTPLTPLTPFTPFAYLLAIGFRYFLSGLKSQSIESLFKYMQSTITPLRTINKSVRRDLCARNIPRGHNEPPRSNISKTCSNWFSF